MIVRLTILTVLEVLALAGALVYYLRRITTTLERIGGLPTSYLAKLRFGLRAIEQETSHLAPLVIQLNQGLTALNSTLGSADKNLTQVAEALSKSQEVSQ